MQCRTLPRHTLTFQNLHLEKHPQFKVSICKNRSRQFISGHQQTCNAILTLTGQNTPASFSFRRTFFSTRQPPFGEDLLNAVPFKRTTCGHRVAGVSVCDTRCPKHNCSSRKKGRRLDFQLFFASLQTSQRLLCELENGLDIEPYSEMCGARPVGAARGTGQMQQHFLFLKWRLSCSRKFLTV